MRIHFVSFVPSAIMCTMFVTSSYIVVTPITAGIAGILCLLGPSKFGHFRSLHDAPVHSAVFDYQAIEA